MRWRLLRGLGAVKFAVQNNPRVAVAQQPQPSHVWGPPSAEHAKGVGTHPTRLSEDAPLLCSSWRFERSFAAYPA